MNKLKFNSHWPVEITELLNQQPITKIEDYLSKQRAQGKIIYPNSTHIFRAFELTPYNSIKVIILGQDPYHGPNQADGLAFSVPSNQALPPSLKNIFKEQENDLKIKQPENGNLSPWARQGVLLLNSSLTVEHKMPNSHQKIGWQYFTDKVIEILARNKKNLVFMLWGKFAQNKKKLIDHNQHLILSSTHPSPLSAHRGFLGCSHFSQCNHYLEQTNQKPIDWSL